MSKLVQVKGAIVQGSINPVVYDRLRLFNPKSPFRRAMDGIRRWAVPTYFSKTDSWENSLLLLLFNNTNVANVGDATGLRGSSTAGSLYFALHTSDPGETGDQTTNEATYTSYARVAVARSGAGFTVSGTNPTQVVPAATVTFPAGTGGSGTATHFSIGTASSGAGVRLYNGTVTPNIVTGNGVTPSLTTATAITED